MLSPLSTCVDWSRVMRRIFPRREGEPDVGKFTLTLVRGAGDRWLIVSDMDNGNSRP